MRTQFWHSVPNKEITRDNAGYKATLKDLKLIVNARLKDNRLPASPPEI